MAESFALDEIRPGFVDDTDDKQRAHDLHAHLVTYGFQVRRFVKALCVDLSVMHDDKLYTLLGYTNFYDYCSQALNIESTQAKKYVTVGVFIRSFELGHPGDEKVTNCNNFSDLGIEKMYLIARLKSPEFDALKQEGNFYHLSKRDLKKKIDSIKLDQKQREDKNFNGDLSEFRKMVQDGTDEYNKLSSFAPSDEPSISDPVVRDWYSYLLQLQSLLQTMDNYWYSHSDKLDSSVTSVFLSRALNRVNFDIDNLFKG